MATVVLNLGLLMVTVMVLLRHTELITVVMTLMAVTAPKKNVQVVKLVELNLVTAVNLTGLPTEVNVVTRPGMSMELTVPSWKLITVGIVRVVNARVTVMPFVVTDTVQVMKPTMTVLKTVMSQVHVTKAML